MYVYTIQQILDARSLYREPPYPGFSLEEACRRKKMSQTKLVRGANAWVTRGAAKTTDEWVERLVQGSLNKLSEANFDAMVEKLQTNVIFSSEETLKKAVSLIFTKALDEPENSKSYAGVCYKIAMFEVGMNAAQPPMDGKKQSKFRNAIVGVAQEEFGSRRQMPSVDGLSEEEIEQQRTTFMRRKRANMKFIGELFMHKVLSHNTMMSIIQTIMQEAEKGGHPTSEDIEFLTELFLTIGECLDTVPEMRVKVDGYFKQLERLKDQKDVYPPRIRFKMLDLIELRRDLNWEPRATKAPVSQQSQSQSQSQPQPQSQQQAKMPARSPTVGSGATTPTSGGKKAKQTAPVVSAADSNRSWRNVVKSDAAAATGTATGTTATGTAAGTTATGTAVSGPSALRASGSEAVVSFEGRVRSMFQEWVAEYSNDFIPEWLNEFRNCSHSYTTEVAICKAVASVVVREACMTTKSGAQREANGFLVVGLFLTDEEVFDGFAMALAWAIEEGVLEDVPKFSERFIHMLCITSGEDAVTDVYYDTARVLCKAYGLLQDPDETTTDTLMEFWSKIPPPQGNEVVVMPLPVVQLFAEMPAKGQEPLAGRIIASLHTIGIIDGETVKEWLALPHEGICATVADEFKKAMNPADV